MNRLAVFFESLPPVLAMRMATVYALKRVVNADASINYSQTGEDAIIRSLMDESIPGIYVDVGCHDPIRSSNTLSLYLHGWHGVNIDANPKLIDRFKATRLRDVAVCAAISDTEKDVVFHEFDDALVSTLSEEMLPEWQRKWRKVRERMVRTRTLDSVLQEHLRPGEQIDLLSVDVEGHDLNVLRSIDLDRFRPKLIVVEIHQLDLDLMRDHPVIRHLAGQGYRQVAYDSLNGYFVDTRSARTGMRLP
jgi:FkbM family methyltransferase